MSSTTFHSTRFRKTARRPRRRIRRHAYVLLETVIATGLLILGLAVLGAQFQDSTKTVQILELRAKALALAESNLAELSLGLVEFDSMDDLLEEEFGSRDPSWGRRMILDETSTPGIVHLTVDILYYPRETDEEEFDYDLAETIYTMRTLRLVPQKIDVRTAYGLTDEEYEDLESRLVDSGVSSIIDLENFDPAMIGKLDFDELLEVLPPLFDVMGVDIDTLLGQLPPDLRELVDEMMSDGLLDENGEAKDEAESGGPN